MDTFFFERAEAGFDSLWEMLLDCAVHDIDLACFLLKPPYRWVTVQLGHDVLRATLQSSDKRRAYFHWKIGDERVRTVANHNVRVDFTENCFDLLSLQLDAFLGAQSDMDGRGLANLEDGLMVMNLLESLKAKVGRFEGFGFRWGSVWCTDCKTLGAGTSRQGGRMRWYGGGRTSATWC